MSDMGGDWGKARSTHWDRCSIWRQYAQVRSGYGHSALSRAGVRRCGVVRVLVYEHCVAI